VEEVAAERGRGGGLRIASAPVVVAVLVMVVWGATPILTRLALEGMEPLFTGLVAADGLPRAGATAWGAVLFLAVVTSIVGYVGWYWALDRGGIQRIATLQFLQPLSGFALAAVVLGDRVTLPIAVGSVLIVTGILVAQRA